MKYSNVELSCEGTNRSPLFDTLNNYATVITHSDTKMHSVLIPVLGPLSKLITNSDLENPAVFHCLPS